MAPEDIDVQVQPNGRNCSRRHGAQRSQARAAGTTKSGDRHEHIRSKKTRTLSWRIGAYRQPDVMPARSAKEEPGTHGVLILKDKAIDPSPEPPMSWTGPLNDCLNEGPLFHYYGANIPSLVYGVRKDGLWCPVRAMSMPCGLMYPSQFRWMLIMSETHMAARRGVAPPLSLYKRKAAAYQQLNAALADPVNKFSFETILGVNAALFVEARIVGPEITRMHLKALDQLYVARNRQFAEDKDSFAALLRLSIYTAYLLCECEVSSCSALKSTMWASLAKLEAIEQWTLKLRQQRCRAIPEATPEDTVRSFRKAKRHLLEHRAVKPLIAQPLAYMSYTHIASHFSVLLLLNLSLYELGQEIGTFFLERLLLIIENSMEEDRSGKSLLKLPALPMMMAQARLDVLHTYTRQELGLADDVVDESLETRNSMIDALKLFSYFSEENRKRLIAVLFDWLADDSSSQVRLSREVLDELGADVDCNWVRQQRIAVILPPSTLK